VRVVSVVRSDDREWELSPWQILIDGVVFLNGIEFQKEAESVAEFLRTVPEAQPANLHPEKIISLGKRIPGMRLVRPARPLGQRGSVLLEFALCLPVLMVLLLGSLDLLLCLTCNGDVHSLADAGAQCIVTPSCGNAVQYVQGAAAGLSLNPAQLTVSQSGNSITVSYGYQPVSFVFPAVNLSATATAP
jgi:hypothetical protein